MKASKSRLEIEGLINSLYNTNILVNDNDGKFKNINDSYDNEIEKLKKSSQEISQKIAIFKENINNINKILEADNTANANLTIWKQYLIIYIKSKNSYKNRKLSNVQSSVHELISYFDKAYKFKIEKIKYVKDKENLFIHSKIKV